MKPGSRATFPVLACLMLTILACSLGSPAEGPAGGGAQAPTAENPTSQDSATATTAPVTREILTSTTSAPAEGPAQRDDADLSETEILQIVRSSLAAFPWRLNQNVLNKATQQTSLTVTEAQTSTRGYNRSVQPLGSETVTIESIVIDSLVFVKITNRGVAETYGLVDGQWTELPPGSPLLQLVDTSAIDPARIAGFFATDFASLRGDAGANDQLLFKLVGPEEINGVATNIYESTGAGFTYRWWIGADGRFYKSTLDTPQATRTLLIEYDPGITVQAPIP